MATTDDLCRALFNRVGYEPVAVDASEEQIVLMGRLRGNTPDLLLIAHQLLVEALNRPWEHETSKVFVLKGRKLVHGWRLIFQVESGNVQDLIPEFIQVINRTPKAKRKELTSVDLPGGNRYRGGYKDGKGAGLTGQHKTGAAAFISALRGGNG